MPSRNKSFLLRSLCLRTATASPLLACCLACTDANVYQLNRDPFQENKLTLTGRVCSDDLRERNFPVKILFLIDTSNSLAATENDASGARGKAIDSVLATWGQNPNYHFGVVAFAGRPRSLVEEGFTQDPARLSAAAAAVQTGGGLVGGVNGCFGPRCRDIRGAMSLANSLITGDILAADPGENSRTSYVIILFAGGPPAPGIGRCACRDVQTETRAGNWPSCPWDDCGCRVACPEQTRCNVDECIPQCTPGCGGSEYCDYNNGQAVCQSGSPPPGGIRVTPIGTSPASAPDTFALWTLPVDHGLDLSQTRALVAGQTPGPCVPTCVYYPNGGGHVDSCEERVLVNQVRELRNFARENGTAQLQLHTTYLPDRRDYSATPNDQLAPTCGDSLADEARSVRLLSEMAFAGDGGFTQFGVASAITFADIDLRTNRQPLVVKELVVSNASVLPTSDGIKPDSDLDGLEDEAELAIGSCPSDPDTDGDGLNDAVEVKLASDPLRVDDPIECVDLPSTDRVDDDLCAPGEQKVWKAFQDRDGDQLNACEERLIGTSDSLFDSDADGLPDKLEFINGTNYLAVDPLADIDFDGIVNREEVRGHTDARSNDAQSDLDLAYRYEEVDLGIQEIFTFSQPPNITGVTVRSVSEGSTAGVGFLRFDPGPPATLSWKDPEDNQIGGDFGDAVDITDPDPEGYILSSCNRDVSGNCTAESQRRTITVEVQGLANYPPRTTVDQIVISSALRNCVEFRATNITLLETLADPDLQQPGNNTVFVYFAQAPKDAKDTFGIFRVASVRINYLAGPPERRTPRDARIELSDADFVLFE